MQTPTTISEQTVDTFVDALEAKREALVVFSGYRNLAVAIERVGTQYVVRVTADV